MRGEKEKRKFRGYSNGLSLSRSFCRSYNAGSGLALKHVEIVKMLRETEGLTVRSVAAALPCSRRKASKILKALSLSGLVSWVDILGESGDSPLQFRLWFLRGTSPPASAQEACRLAVYGLFYALARKDAPGFTWQVSRQDGVLVVEMGYLKDGQVKKWQIDAPRQDEEALDQADIYIFPTESMHSLPGKLFITDNALLRARSLKEAFAL